MKSTLYLLFLSGLLSSSCGNKTSESTTATDTTTALPANSAPSPAPVSYVGKTTSELEAQGAHYCGGHILEGSAYDANAFYITTYAASEAECTNGENRIVLERKLSNNASGKANMLVLAELNVVEKNPEQSHFVTRLSVNGGKQQFYAVEYYEDGSQTVKQVGKLWLVNTATNQFEEVAVPAGFSFPHPYNDLVD